MVELVCRLDEDVSRSDAGARERERAIEQFFRGHELRALRIAELGVQDRDQALDCVQEAMIRLAEWKPLFYRILNNQVRDCQRRRARELRYFGNRVDVHEEPLPAGPGADPEALQALDQSRHVLERALAQLPLRQQQAFVLRAWEGLDTRDTAFAMGVTQGSVKTHYHRALGALRRALEEPS